VNRRLLEEHSCYPVYLSDDLAEKHYNGGFSYYLAVLVRVLIISLDLFTRFFFAFCLLWSIPVSLTYDPWPHRLYSIHIIHDCSITGPTQSPVLIRPRTR